MAFYDLAGSGVQALSPGTTHLFLQATSLPANVSTGRAIPTNYFHVGLIRPQYQGASYPPQPIDATTMIVILPPLCDGLGYSLTPSTTIHVTEA